MSAFVASCNLPLRQYSALNVSHAPREAATATFVDFAPSVALLERKVDGVSGHCTGTLVDHRTLLTAAHCLVDAQGRLIKSKSIRALLRSSANEPWTYYGVDSLSIAPKFKPGKSWSTGSIKNFDFGLIVLIEKVAAKFTQRLPTVVLSTSQLHGMGIPRGMFYFAGYGGFVDSHSPQLRVGSGEAKSIDDCIEPIQRYHDEQRLDLGGVQVAAPGPSTGKVGMFCTVTEKNGYYTEKGDSGGPAFVERDGRFYVLGVTSAGNGDNSRAVQKISTFESLDDFSTVAWFRRVLGLRSLPCIVQ